MAERIFLSGIEVYAFGGVTDAEKETGQRYRVDVELEVDLSLPAQSDDLAHTVHYGEVYSLVVEVLREKRFNLIEHAAARVADRLLRAFPVERVTVRLAKLLPPIDGVVASAAVEVSRTRERARPG
jgi:dihydroneopterin aldolase